MIFDEDDENAVKDDAEKGTLDALIFCNIFFSPSFSQTPLTLI